MSGTCYGLNNRDPRYTDTHTRTHTSIFVLQHFDTFPSEPSHSHPTNHHFFPFTFFYSLKISDRGWFSPQEKE